MAYYGKLKLKGSDDAANLTALHIGNTRGRDSTGEENIVKIFSEQYLSDAWLQDMFQGEIGWQHRTEVRQITSYFAGHNAHCLRDVHPI